MSTASFEYDEENVGTGAKNWDMGTSGNSMGFGGESWSYEYIAHQNQNVHLLQKIKPVSSRPRIPATLSERLAFFRGYFNSYGKSIIHLEEFDFNGLIWDYFVYVVFKLIPTSYIYHFLGSYVPEEHLYISKMVPIFAGYNLLLVIASIAILTFQGHYVILSLYYAIAGLIFQSPWKNCIYNYTEFFSMDFDCIDIISFQRLKNESVRIKRYRSLYTVSSKDNVTRGFIPAPYLYNMFISYELGKQYKYNYIILFITAGLFYKQLYKKYIWKVLYTFQNVLQIIYAASFVHLLLISLESQFGRTEEEDEAVQDDTKHVKFHDSNMFQEMVHAPPLIHFMTSRTTDQINPASDTALLVLSNTMFFFLKLLTHQKIIRYCEYVCGLHLRQFSIKYMFVFFFWPLYLSTVPFGDIIVIVLYVVNFMTEFLTFVISYQTFIEVILSNWENLRKWIALSILIAMSIIIPTLIILLDSTLIFVTILWASAFIEVVVIVYFYPFHRLRDDIEFHYGSAPSQFTQGFIQSVPIIYFILFYQYTERIVQFCKIELCWIEVMKSLYIGFFVVGVIMLIGTVFMVIKLICFSLEEWGALIRPVPDWGPQEHIQRQLRKYYDSREYIRSRDSRYLSRYLLTRASERSYQLDLLYERRGARTSLLQDALKIHNEKLKEKSD